LNLEKGRYPEQLVTVKLRDAYPGLQN